MLSFLEADERYSDKCAGVTPVCIGCDKRLTIEHILLTCSDFIEIRDSHFTAKSLRMLFKDISPPEKIFHFLKEINIFGKI